VVVWVTFFIAKHLSTRLCVNTRSVTPWQVQPLQWLVRQCYCLMTTCATLYSECNHCLHIEQLQQWRCCSENMRNVHLSAHLHTLTGHTTVNTSTTKNQLQLRPTLSLTQCTQNHTHIKVKHILHIVYIHQGLDITLSQFPN